METQSQLDAAVAALAEHFREALEQPAKAAVTLDSAELRRRFAEPLPEHGAAPEDVLAELVERCEDGLAGGTGGRYFGYVTGGALPAAAIAEAWAAAVDQNVGMWPLGPAAAELDEVVLGWLRDLLDLPHESGAFGSGATMANTISLAVARHWFGRKHDIDVADEGVRALPPFAVYASEELHISDHKALRTLGLGSGSVRAIPIDERYAMRLRPLRQAVERDRAAGIEPAIVIAQAGSVNTGACDPLEDVAELAREHDMWFHVDGAFGAFFRLCERTAPLVRGIERCDSIAIDGHKWLNVPNGVGFAFIRDRELHHETFAGTAGYLTPGTGVNRHEFGFEGSTPWRSASVWAALKSLGREGLVDLVTRCCDLTQELAWLVEESPRLELTAPAPTCVCCFRYRPEGWDDGPRLDELNRRIQAAVAADGDVFHTGAQLENGFCQRAAIVSWRTTSEDVAALAEAVEAAGDRLA